MNTKALVLCMSMALGVPVAAMAGPGHGPKDGQDWAQKREHREERMLERLTSELSLTSDQQAKLKLVFDEQGDKMQALHEDTRAKKRALKEEGDRKIAAVLSTDQKAKYAAFKEARKQEREKRHDGEKRK